MNLDLKTPPQRIQNILDLVQPLYLITDEAHLAMLSGLWPREKTLIWERDAVPFDRWRNAELMEQLERVIDTDPLCLINTSGSTGTPKSVEIGRAHV